MSIISPLGEMTPHARTHSPGGQTPDMKRSSEELAKKNSGKLEGVGCTGTPLAPIIEEESSLSNCVRRSTSEFATLHSQRQTRVTNDLT